MHDVPGRISVEGFSVAYGHKQVIDSVTTSFEPGRITGLVGPNGSGKSTLLRAIAGVQGDITAGRALIDGRSIGEYPRRERVRKLAMVAQHESVSTAMTPRHIIELGILTGRGLFAELTDDDRREVERSIEHSDIAPIADRPWNHLSGGERQRTQLARAMAQRADVLVLDEPTNHLDLHHRHRLLARLEHQARDHGLCVVIAVHDLDLAARYCQHVVVLEGGRVRAEGAPRQALSRALLADVFGIEARLRDGDAGAVSLEVTGTIANWQSEEHAAS